MRILRVLEPPFPFPTRNPVPKFNTEWHHWSVSQYESQVKGDGGKAERRADMVVILKVQVSSFLSAQ